MPNGSRQPNAVDQMTPEQWRATRKEAGLKIDPQTAEVDWSYAQTLDPYGLYPDLPEDCQQVGREYFARSPGSDIWVHFSDLPEATQEALYNRRQPSFTIRDDPNKAQTDDELAEKINSMLARNHLGEAEG